MFRFYGVDVGCQNTTIVRDDAEIVRTDTGSLSRPTLVSFNGMERYVGEGAFAYISNESTVTMLPELLGKSLESVKSSETFKHRKCAIEGDEGGRLLAAVRYCEEESKVSVTALLGMLIADCWQRVIQVSGEVAENSDNAGTAPTPALCFALPPNCNKSIRRAFKEAAAIAGVPREQVHLFDGADCIVAAYSRKLDGLGASERVQLEGRHVLLTEMGHMRSSAIVVKIIKAEPTGDPLVDKENRVLVRKVAEAHDDALGAHHLDARIYEHLAAKCPQPVVPGSKAGFRLMSGCEKLRKLLSQLAEAQITVERIADDSDMSFPMKRDELSTVTADLLDRFKQLLLKATNDAAAAVECDDFSLVAVEILGGGARMQVVQQLIYQVWAEVNKREAVKQQPFGAKLDDGSVALGAALLAKAGAVATVVSAAVTEESSEDKATPMEVCPTDESNESVGLNAIELAAAQKSELKMQSRDQSIRRVMAQRNSMESYILEMRSAVHKKHGDKIDAARLNTVLDEYENWMWEEGYHTSDCDLIESKNASLRSAVAEICADFFTSTEADRVAIEQALEAEAALAAAERAANGDEEEDHDNRKLRKPDRMRLVVKNKEEGTELFKGKNFRPAAARYQKALTHCAKFFDLSKEDEEEVNSIKLSLYLNLASCYIKLENWEQVSRHCEEALVLDPSNVKALFRRSAFFEQKKDWDSALSDIKKCQQLNEKEDKLITQAAERVKREIQKEKAREKKTWGKMFG